MIVQPRHEQPATHERKPAAKPSRPAAKRPAAPQQKKGPAKPTPKRQAPQKRGKPEPKGRKSAGRDDVVLWVDEVEFAPLAFGGHIH